MKLNVSPMMTGGKVVSDSSGGVWIQRTVGWTQGGGWRGGVKGVSTMVVFSAKLIVPSRIVSPASGVPTTLYLVRCSMLFWTSSVSMKFTSRRNVIERKTGTYTVRMSG